MLFSSICTAISLVIAKRPDPASLVDFYRRVRPIGWWGPVRALAPEVVVRREALTILIGVVSGLTATYGAMFSLGFFLLDRSADGWIALGAAVVGTAATVVTLSRLSESSTA